jgi:steroid delta-isomerase-like uncharacterized protein
MSEQNKSLVRRAFEEVYNLGKLEVVDELVANDIVIHAAAAEFRGPADLKQYVAALRGAFPDLHLTIDQQIAEGDTVVTRWTARGTHLGAFQGIPPTGKQGSMTGIDIDRFAGGKTVECWTNADELGLLQQLGVLPGPEHAVR